MAGVLGAWAACPLFSSEKSCLITSKKLLNGLPGYTKQETKKRKEWGRGRGRREKEQTNERRGLDERKESPAAGPERAEQGPWQQAGWAGGRRVPRQGHPSPAPPPRATGATPAVAGCEPAATTSAPKASSLAPDQRGQLSTQTDEQMADRHGGHGKRWRAWQGWGLGTNSSGQASGPGGRPAGLRQAAPLEPAPPGRCVTGACHPLPTLLHLLH